MDVAWRRNHTVAVMSVHEDELSRPKLLELADELEPLLGLGRPLFLFDVRDVRFVDSSGIGFLVHVSHRSQERGGATAIVGPGAAFEGRFGHVGGGGSLSVFGGIEEAVEFLAARGREGTDDGA